MADPITLIVVGTAGFALWKSYQAKSAEVLPPATTDLGPRPPGPSNGPVSPDMISKLGGDLTSVLPEDFAKKASSLLAAAAAAAAAALAGQELGNEIDKFFGGTGKGATGIIIRVGVGGSLALGAGLCTLIALKMIGITYMVALSYTGIGLLITAAVWLVATVISDLNELAYGQEGARKELLERYYEAKESLRPMLLEAVPGLSADAQERILVPLAQSYIDEFNKIRYDSWMKTPWGLGQGRAYHAQFGLDRGKFYSYAGVDGGNGDMKQPWEYAVTPPETQGTGGLYAWVRKFLPPDEIEVTKVTRTGVRTVLDGAATQTSKNAKTRAIQMKSGAVGAAPKAVYKTESYSYEEVQYLDRKRKDIDDAGRLLANSIAYARWMGEDHGVGFTDYLHAKRGMESGKFHGTINANSQLVYGAFIIDWREGVVKGAKELEAALGAKQEPVGP